MSVPQREIEPSAALGARFAGRPAGVGIRLAAFTIDAAALVLAIATTLVLTRSVTLGAVVGAQVIIGLCVAQARTGATLGSLLLRLRVSQVDRPYSPGLGRSALRGLVIAGGALVGVVGAWIVELSAAWDASGRRRSWADLAAGTVVIEAPRIRAPRASGAPPVEPAPAALAAPAVFTIASGSGDDEEAPVAMPVTSRRVRRAEPANDDAVAAVTPQVVDASPAPMGLISAAPAVIAPAAAPAGPPHRSAYLAPGGAVAAPAPTPASAPPAAAASRADERAGRLVMIVDTGQREELTGIASVNLGRRPEVSEAGDLLITVGDPEHTVSKTHARLEHTRAGTWITDNGSTNGTELVNEDGTTVVLTPGVRTLVEDGTRVRLGNRTVTLTRVVGGS